MISIRSRIALAATLATAAILAVTEPASAVWQVDSNCSTDSASKEDGYKTPVLLDGVKLVGWRASLSVTTYDRCDHGGIRGSIRIHDANIKHYGGYVGHLFHYRINGGAWTRRSIIVQWAPAATGYSAYSIDTDSNIGMTRTSRITHVRLRTVPWFNGVPAPDGQRQITCDLVANTCRSVSVRDADDKEFVTDERLADGVPDVYAVNRNDAYSGTTAVHILNGADNFKSFLGNHWTALHPTDGTWDFATADANRDGIADLYAINRNDAGSGRTAVHILNGADNFKSFLGNHWTALHPTDGTWDFATGDANRDGAVDVYAINRQDGGSGRTAVHILNGADNFKSFLGNHWTALHPTNTMWDFATGDANRDGVLDVYAINRHDASTGRTAVHILNGADTFKSYLGNHWTALHPTDGSWAFGAR